MGAGRKPENGHWTDDDLLRRLYGLEPEGLAPAHLAACRECRERYETLLARRNEVRPMPPADEQRLRAQREAVWSRVENRRRLPLAGWRVPAAATAAVLALAVWIARPGLDPAGNEEDPLVEIAEIASPQPLSDTQFFEEIALAASSPEPRGAAAVENLFEGGGD